MSNTNILDVVLNFFRDKKDNRIRQIPSRAFPQLFKDNINNPKIHFQQGILNDLQGLNLVTHNGHVSFDSRVYFITQKGIDVLENGGMSEYFKQIKIKEDLEIKILKATDQSFTLNKIQFRITLIIAIGTFLALIFQILMYISDSEKNRLEIEKLKIELKKV